MLKTAANFTAVDYSWILGNDVKGFSEYSEGVNVCCATFPHLGADGKTILKDKYCYPRTVLNMERDQRYLLPTQVNPYPLAWCSSVNLVLGAAVLITSVLLC